MNVLDAVTAASALAAVLIAWRGLSVWREQLRTKDDYELARRYLRAIYDVREAFKLVRNPMIFAGEFQQAMAEPGAENDPADAMGEAGEVAVYDQRWKTLAEAWSSANEAGLDAEVLWEKPRSELIEGLRSLIGELRSSLWRMMRERRLMNPNLDALHAAEQVVYFQGDGDAFDAKADSAIAQAEKFLRQKLLR